MLVRNLATCCLSLLVVTLSPETLRTSRGDKEKAPTDLGEVPRRPYFNDRTATRLSEDEIINWLASPELTKEEFTCLLRALGRFERRPETVAELIRWLEYVDWSQQTGRSRWSASYQKELSVQHPAEEALKRMGVFAVPQLVEEYILSFENTVRDTRSRLASITLILWHTPEAASLAAEVAWKRMEEQPDDDRLLRACRELTRLPEKFHHAERERLFKSPTFAPTSDRAAIVPLLDEWLDDEERARRLADLAQFRESPIAVAQLIQRLEFRPKPHPRLASNDPPGKLETYPAAVALVEIGPFAASQLVGEFIHYFESTSIEANRKRLYPREVCDDKARPLEVQSPAPRLSLIVTILTQQPETARRAVENAQKRLESERDSRARRACKDLIEQIIDRFPAGERNHLFPRVSLAK